MSQIIAFAGCTDRIGTTTQAIQFTKWIKENGYKSCYAEVNKTGYLDQMQKIYARVSDRGSYINFQDIDMFKKAYAHKISERRYDFIIKDYGSFEQESFEETSFAEQPIKILVCGSNPKELIAMKKCYENPLFENAFYIFSFVPEAEQVSILTIMKNRVDRTFFVDDIRNPFDLSPLAKKNFLRILKSSKKV